MLSFRAQTSAASRLHGQTIANTLLRLPLHCHIMVPVALPLQAAKIFAAIPPRVLYLLALAAGMVSLYLGARASAVVVFVLATCLAMLAFAGYLAQWVTSKDEGTADMQEV